MPNWCENVATLVAPTTDAAVEMEAAFHDGRFFGHLISIPDDDPLWHEKRCAAWGVKWEIAPQHGSILRDGLTIKCDFISAWNAPLEFYHHLMGLGWEVDGAYFDGCIPFGGRLNENGHERWYHGDIIPIWLTDAFGEQEFDYHFDGEDEEA